MSLITVSKIQKESAATNIDVPSTGQFIDLASAAQGDVLYYNGTSYVRLGAGTSGQVLTSGGAGANPSWGAGSTNTPYFYAYLSADQSPANNTWTKVTCDTVAFQTGSTYDNSTNYRWTPGVAGKYFIAGQCEARSATNHSVVQMDISIYKNGSQFISGVPFLDATSSPTIIMGYINGIIDMNTTDYVEFWGAIDTGASARRWDDGYQTTHFMGYKLLD